MTGVVSGITGTDGTGTLFTSNLTAEAGTTVTFTVEAVAGDGLIYDDTDNHETSITVKKS